MLYAGCPGAPDKDRFSVHGISLRSEGNSSYTVFAVNHGGESLTWMSPRTIRLFHGKARDSGIIWQLDDSPAGTQARYL